MLAASPTKRGFCPNSTPASFTDVDEVSSLAETLQVVIRRVTGILDPPGIQFDPPHVPLWEIPGPMHFIGIGS